MNIKPLNSRNAYRIERYSDLVAGEILRHIPVTADGIQDPMRTEVFTGKTMMQTNRGPIELYFDLSASSLSEAFNVWDEALQTKLDELQSEAMKVKILNGAGLNPGQAKLLKGN